MTRADWKKGIGLGGGAFAVALAMSASVPAQKKSEDLRRANIADRRRHRQKRRNSRIPAAGRRCLRTGEGFLGAVLSILMALVLPTYGLRAAEQSDVAGEYQIKAAFLFHFAQFVDWPPEAFKEADSPIVYCTLGEDPFRGALDASLRGKMLGQRPLQVRHLHKADEAPACQVLFVGGDERRTLAATLASVEGSPTLTVGDAEHFAAEGGMIGFCLEDNKIRFEINVAAAERAKLKISARLLALAKTVIGRPKGN